MSTVQPLARFAGTAHGVRTVKIDAKPAVVDEATGEIRYEAKEASSFDEVGIAVRGRFGDTITEGNTATISVLLPEGSPSFAAGDEVDIWAVGYVRWTPGFRGGRAFPQVAYRFAGMVEQPAAAVRSVKAS